MNTVFIILAIIGLLVAIVLVAALFVKKDYTIEKEIIINRGKLEVFDYIRQLKNQDNYNKWVMADPGMKKSFTGADGAEGFIYGWDSENKQVGTGEMEITNIEDGQRVDIVIRFERPFKGISDCYMETADAGNGKATVKWGFKSSMKYPMNILLAVFKLEEKLGNDLQNSLSNLKNVLETSTIHG